MMRAIRCLQPGGLEVLNISLQPVPVPKPNEVLIKIHATALNRADILQRKGLYPPPKGFTDILGLECSGEIASSNTHWPLGARVMGFLRGGGYAEYVSVHKDHVLPIPNNLSFVEAAAISEVWLTAYKCLIYIANATAGQSVLIHAGASGVGTALISLAKWKGLKVFATCGSEAKAKICSDLGADLVWNYKNGGFKDPINQAGGADLIMDSIGASYFNDNIGCINREGKWVVYGFLGGSKVKDFDMFQVFGKLVSLHFTSFRSRSDEYRTDVIKNFINDGILQGFETKTFRPLIYKEIPFDDIKSGHQLMENNENFGKIVVKVTL